MAEFFVVRYVKGPRKGMLLHMDQHGIDKMGDVIEVIGPMSPPAKEVRNRQAHNMGVAGEKGN